MTNKFWIIGALSIVLLLGATVAFAQPDTFENCIGGPFNEITEEQREIVRNYMEENRPSMKEKIMELRSSGTTEEELMSFREEHKAQMKEDLKELGIDLDGFSGFGMGYKRNGMTGKSGMGNRGIRMGFN